MLFRSGGDGGHEAADLLLPDAAEGADAARAEQLEDADPAELAPELAVAAEDEARPISGQDLDGGAVAWALNYEPRERGECVPKKKWFASIFPFFYS